MSLLDDEDVLVNNIINCSQITKELHRIDFNKKLNSTLNDIRKITNIFDSFLNNYFPNYHLSVNYNDRKNNITHSYRGYNKKVFDIIIDLIYSQNIFKNIGSIQYFKFDIDKYKIKVNGTIFSYERRGGEYTFNMEISIYKERWTEDGYKYICSDQVSLDDIIRL
jgi:hypothetical protein